MNRVMIIVLLAALMFGVYLYIIAKPWPWPGNHTRIDIDMDKLDRILSMSEPGATIPLDRDGMTFIGTDETDPNVILVMNLLVNSMDTENETIFISKDYFIESGEK